MAETNKDWNGLTIEMQPKRGSGSIEEWGHHWVLKPRTEDPSCFDPKWECKNCGSTTMCDPKTHMMFQPCSKHPKKATPPAETAADSVPTHSGKKFLRLITGWDPVTGKTSSILVDVYDVLAAFDDPPAPRSHAIKKLLCAGIRGKGDVVQDLTEARDALDRDIQKTRQLKQAPPG